MPQSYFNNFRALGIFVTISLYRKGLKMKTVTLTDDEIDILEDILLLVIEDEENNNSLSRDEEYIFDLKLIYKKITEKRFNSEKYVDFDILG